MGTSGTGKERRVSYFQSLPCRSHTRFVVFGDLFAALFFIRLFVRTPFLHLVADLFFFSHRRHWLGSRKLWRLSIIYHVIIFRVCVFGCMRFDCYFYTATYAQIIV
ncbi:hypothetical protein P153DRAFT_126664 [Dothidotthia symphoricarpi CBS 119687]|uniref:Uncharacterized protein n=1 Tax=Dothidotthia symphoricarpi CBS 119687 TaxID=1392245 RepID=A0A6A5ZYD1_9PLEO|nr:uncharacterized protein P153DRAFT_126664 [Dothidotthia symphoricarpi CBS 119687]KAF2124752.1 hypothetical protein P153DRAFT_126664 [Dothidotthia symphoricarpi CBS 119687]